MQGAFALVRGSSSASNLLEPPHCRDRAKCVEFCNMGSGWFDCTEPTCCQLDLAMHAHQGLIKVQKIKKIVLYSGLTFTCEMGVLFWVPRLK